MLHTVNDYLNQAEHNRGLADFLRDSKVDCLDWAVTCLFYSAVHYVNAYLRKNNITIPRRHKGDQRGPGRTTIVQQDPALSVIYASYRHLNDESRDARYELKKINAADYDKFLVTQLDKIEAYIIPKVSS